MRLINELYKNIEKNIALKEDDKLKLINLLEITVKDFDVSQKDSIEGSFNDLIEEYLLNLKMQGYSLESIKNKKYCLNKVNNYINKNINELTYNDIKSYIFTRNDLKAVSLNNIISTIKAFLSWCFDEEYIEKDISKKIKKVKEPIRVKRNISQFEIEEIKNNCSSNRDRALVELALSSGIRASEIINIKKSDINFDSNQILVLGKGNKQRTVLFTDKAKYYILKYIKERNDNIEYLFVSERKPYNQLTRCGLYRIIKRVKDKCGIEERLSPHNFRHCFATSMLNNGADITVIQRLLGHENIDTTMKYAEVSASTIKSEYNKYII